MSKTMSIRMDRENFEFLNELTKEQRSDFSKAVRDMVTRAPFLSEQTGEAIGDFAIYSANRAGVAQW